MFCPKQLLYARRVACNDLACLRMHFLCDVSCLLRKLCHTLLQICRIWCFRPLPWPGICRILGLLGLACIVFFVHCFFTGFAWGAGMDSALWLVARSNYKLSDTVLCITLLFHSFWGWGDAVDLFRNMMQGKWLCSLCFYCFFWIANPTYRRDLYLPPPHQLHINTAIWPDFLKTNWFLHGGNVCLQATAIHLHDFFKVVYCTWSVFVWGAA